jgi:hypothetical protein
MPGCRCRRCAPWWVVAVRPCPPPNGGAESGSRGGSLVVGYAQLAKSVRSLASCVLSWASSAWDVAAVTGLDASLEERRAIVWTKICELLPAVLSTFSGHANRLSPPTSRQPAQTISRGPSQPPPHTLWNRADKASHHMHLLTFACRIASSACV